MPLCSHRIFKWTTTPLQKFQVIVKYYGPWELGLITNYPLEDCLTNSIAGTALMFLNLGWDILLKSVPFILGYTFSYLISRTGRSYFLS